MLGDPFISIVTPSFNQGRYIRETLQSLVDQEYPNLEVIIQDGGSTDGAVAIAQEFVERHPRIFRLFVEKDAGQADALNRGFKRTKGEILGFLNSDDTLYAGCLRSVAHQIDPDRNRHIVVGRCLFTGEDSIYVGVEHPSFYTSHFEHLAIWKRGHNTLPQPSVFWHRKVWEQCGGFDVNENHALDYDLFCRFSQHHRFHKVDELWSTYRMHAVSKSSQRTETEILALCIAVSQRYWGSWFNPLRWRCEFSYRQYRQHNHERARHHARRSEEAAQAKKHGTAVIEFVLTAWHSPRMARDRLLIPYAGAKRFKLLQRLLNNSEGGFTGRYDADSWVGPLYRHDFLVPSNACRLLLILQHSPQGKDHRSVKILLRLNRKPVISRKFTEPGQYVVEADIHTFQGRRCMIELLSDSFFVPRIVHNVPDDRQLSIQLMETRVETTEDQFTGRYEDDLWIGPLYRQHLSVPGEGRRLVVILQHSPQGGKHQSVRTTVYLDQQVVASEQYTTPGRYTIEVSVKGMQGRSCNLELRSDNYFVTGPVHNAADNRRLSIQLMDVRVENTDAGFSGRYEGDFYVGPHFHQNLTVPPHAIRLALILQHKPQQDIYRTVNVVLHVNREKVAAVQCTAAGEYVLEADLRKLQGQTCAIELFSDNFFVPRAIHQVPDDRQLSVQLIETRIEPKEDGFTGRYEADSFVGPYYRQELAVPAQACRVVINLLHAQHGDTYREVEVTLLIDGQLIASQHCATSGPYVLKGNLDAWQGRTCVVELRSDNYFVPKVVHHVPDERQLSIQLMDTRIELAKPDSAGTTLV